MMSNITYLPKIILSKPRMDLKGHRLTCAFILVVLIIMIFLRLLRSNAFRRLRLAPRCSIISSLKYQEVKFANLVTFIWGIIQ